jgi:hypothetical protein
VADQILSTLEDFEKANQSLEILNFTIESGDDYIDGIWLTHRQKV